MEIKGESGKFKGTLRPFAAIVFLSLAASAMAENGAEAWLRYAPISKPERYRSLPSRIVPLSGTTANLLEAHELQRGLTTLLGRPFTVSTSAAGQDAILVGSASDRRPPTFSGLDREPIVGEQFRIGFSRTKSTKTLAIIGSTTQSTLFAVFQLLREVATETPIPEDQREAPSAPIRWVNQWDNLDGSVERGYAGRSIFFDTGHVRADLTRVSSYARLLASVGINGCTVNNVNSDLRTLTPEMLREYVRIADAFRPWGVKLSLSVDLSSPQVVGGLKTFDPLDPAVAAWWQRKVDEIYTLIPDFGGFVVKADSEGALAPRSTDAPPPRRPTRSPMR